MKSPYASPFATGVYKSPYNAKKEPIVASPKELDVNYPRYVNFMASNDGCGAYRRGFFSHFVRMTGYGDSVDTNRMITDKGFFTNVKSVTFQRQAAGYQKDYMAYISSFKEEMGFKVIYESDDVVFSEEIPDYNAGKHAFVDPTIRQNCIDMINMVDEVTVTCQYMKDLYIGKTGQTKVTVVPNFMPYWWIGHQYNYKRICDTFERNKKRPRIVYAGSAAHFDLANKNDGVDDFSHVNKFIIDNRHKYKFVFIGSYPQALAPYIQAGDIEAYPWANLLQYPTFLASLEPQALIAPLIDSPFNRSKSDIKFIEACQLGLPCLCQDMVTYSTAPSSLKFKTSEELEEKLDMITNWKNRSKYYKLIPELRKIGETRFLERPENIGCFMEALNTPFGSSDRKFLKKWNP